MDQFVFFGPHQFDFTFATSQTNQNFLQFKRTNQGWWESTLKETHALPAVSDHTFNLETDVKHSCTQKVK